MTAVKNAAARRFQNRDVRRTMPCSSAPIDDRQEISTMDIPVEKKSANLTPVKCVSSHLG